MLDEDLQNFNLGNCPEVSFNNWYSVAKDKEENINAFALATCSNNRPSVRYLLFKGFKENQLVFYSNYGSKKSKEIEENPHGEMAFYWHKSGKQIRVFGDIKKLSLEESKEYFFNRDRESQIASCISLQSSKIPSGTTLQEVYQSKLKELDGRPVPFPDHWGGFSLAPTEWEFFIYGEHRLNHRFQYQKSPDLKWKVSKLWP